MLKKEIYAMTLGKGLVIMTQLYLTFTLSAIYSSRYPGCHDKTRPNWVFLPPYTLVYLWNNSRLLPR